ncbi:hypothetical protein LTR48_005788 [Friedmanniomyces endolithicus]|uniref:Cell wall proline rich protein n=1 Tax=Rachicladosporium monterosium TaxID=1507873 RepID=A0ABR0L104_9PEZI|nr:hypothetical protein LTR48_005788 [Friedmanniomyces endolithicus]KAK5141827.1 hypothetical protein LTR32_005704 [Rachicladosporium monterosium]
MAQVALPSGHHRHTSSIGQLELAGGPLLSGAPRIEMMANPDFSFPALPQASRTPSLQAPGSRSKRPVSMQTNDPSVQSRSLAHRRNQSALPSFSFNAADASGLQEISTPTLTPDESTPDTPSGRHHGHHKRRASEFVGGDSRLGVSGAISSSPTKSNILPLPIPSPEHNPAKRGHRHRRSGALGSTHDARDIMQAATTTEPRASLSLPATPLPDQSEPPPLERASSSPNVGTSSNDTFEPMPDHDEHRPPSRRVGFSDNVEFIPRPLSTISSETESSMSTVRGHSVNNSISSVLSLSTSSPQSGRNPRRSLSTTFEDRSDSRPKRHSLETSKRIEKEGEWLKSRSSQTLERPSSDVAGSGHSVSFAPTPEQHAKSRPDSHMKKHSFSHALGFDRRRSEPAISMKSNEPSSVSVESLQEGLAPVDQTSAMTSAHHLERRSSSTNKVRKWAMSRITKRPKVSRSASSEDDTSVHRPGSASGLVAGKVPMDEARSAETDLDAVFGTQSGDGVTQRLDTPPQPLHDFSTPTSFYTGSFHSPDYEDAGHMVDLDAALGPLKTPQTSASGSMVSQSSSLPDVFEGEGEDEGTTSVLPGRPISAHSIRGEDAGVGIHIVDAAESGAVLGWSGNDGLRIRGGDWEPERPTTSFGNNSSRLSTPSNERRPSSIIDQTIMEESSPIEPVEIVDAEEEPRASSLTKSSDSSETPTLLAASQPGTLVIPHSDGPQSLMTPDTHQTSTFSSPDIGRRQSSFDTSRVGTAASSITDNRTMSSGTGDHNPRRSIDVPSLTSSLSTRMSTMHANSSHRDFSSESTVPTTADPSAATAHRRKRASIQSLSQLVGGSFSSSKSNKASAAADDSRAQGANAVKPPKKEHMLKKLMFWRSKSKQSLRSMS